MYIYIYISLKGYDSTVSIGSPRGLQKVNSDQITLIEQSTTPIEQSPMKAISLLE